MNYIAMKIFAEPSKKVYKDILPTVKMISLRSPFTEGCDMYYDNEKTNEGGGYLFISDFLLS